MKSILKAYRSLEKLAPAILFVSIFIVMLMEIASRKFLGRSFEWNTEYCRYALVWVTFIGAVYVRRENLHIEVAALYDYLANTRRTKTVFVFDVVRFLLSVLFWGFLAVCGWTLSSRVAKFTSSAMDISQFWLYICSTICGALGLLMEFQAFVQRMFRASKDEPEAGA